MTLSEVSTSGFFRRLIKHKGHGGHKGHILPVSSVSLVSSVFIRRRVCPRHGFSTADRRVAENPPGSARRGSLPGAARHGRSDVRRGGGCGGAFRPVLPVPSPLWLFGVPRRPPKADRACERGRPIATSDH